MKEFTMNANEYLPLRDVVFNTLREAILRGDLEPGERLMEIAEDDRIDETERAEFDLIMLDIREIIKSGLEMDVFCAHSTPGT